MAGASSRTHNRATTNAHAAPTCLHGATQFHATKLKEDTWQTVVNVALTEVVEIEVPVELTNKGQFMELLENFCTGRVQAQSWEELD